MYLKEHGAVTPKVGVDIAVPTHKGEFLLLQLPNGQWRLPGRWMDVGGSPFNTAARETRVHRTPLNYPGSVSQINICVGAQPVRNDAKVVLSHEHSDFRWIGDVSEVDDWRPGHKRFFPYIRRACRDHEFFPVISD